MTRTHTGGGERTPGLPLPLIGLVFLVSRLPVLPFPQLASDVGIYTRYAREQAMARQKGVSFYDLHAQEVSRQAEEARAAGNPVSPTDEYRDVEYPPLALAVMRLPMLWSGGGEGDRTNLPVLGASIVGLLGSPSGQGPLLAASALSPGRADGTPDGSFEVRYYFAFRAGMAVVDGVLFVLLVVLARRFFPGENRGEWGQRLLICTASTLVLWPLLYDRLDLLLAALVVLALALLTGRLHYGWSFAVLAGAVLYKLVPVILAPIWIVGAMPADQPLEFRRPRVLAGLAGRAALLVALVVVGFVPFYLSAGTRCLSFFAYHGARPLEIGSLYSSLPLALRPLGHPLTVNYSYGSINLYSPITPALAALSPWLTAGVLLAATVLLLIHCQRLSAGSGSAVHPGATFAQVHPLPLVCYTLLFLMLYIAAGKVFSTQYLLWLAPLVALLPLGRGSRWAFTLAFLLVCVLSTILVPFLFLSDLVGPPPPTLPGAIKEPTDRLTGVIKEPTARVAALLVIRNLLFLGLVVGLLAHLVWRVCAAPTHGERGA